MANSEQFMNRKVKILDKGFYFPKFEGCGCASKRPFTFYNFPFFLCVCIFFSSELRAPRRVDA